MVKHISKIVLASFLLTSGAKAAQLYSDDNNTFTVDVKAQAYAVHDNYGFVNGGKGRLNAPVELTGKVQIESYYTRKFSDDLSATAYVRLDTPTFGYMNTGWGSPSYGYNYKLGTFSYVNKAYGMLDSKTYGSLTFGRYQGVYSMINDYSDVDIFIGTPAHDTLNGNLFGGNPETGFMYNKKLFDDKLSLSAAIDGGKDPINTIVKGNGSVDKFGVATDGTNLKKDYKAAVMAQYNITDTIKVGAAYNLTSYRVSSTINPINNNDLGREMGHTAIAGVNYTNGGTIVGLTGSLQNYQYDYIDTTAGSPKMQNKTTSFGLEAGVAYDISGQQVGFRPQAQFDYKRGYNKIKNKVTDGSSDNNLTNVQALELGLSYYVTPTLYYQAAAVLDLRSDHQIQVADGLTNNTNKATPHHYFGIGVVYKF